MWLSFVKLCFPLLYIGIYYTPTNDSTLVWVRHACLGQSYGLTAHVVLYVVLPTVHRALYVVSLASHRAHDCDMIIAWHRVGGYPTGVNQQHKPCYMY